MDAVHHAPKRSVLGEFGKFLSCHQQAVANCPFQAAVQFFRMSLNFLARSDDQFGCGGGSGRAQVGDKVNDREIGLVSNRRDHGNFRFGNGTGEAFMIEAGQILGGPATARDDDDLNPRECRAAPWKYRSPAITSVAADSPCTCAG